MMIEGLLASFLVVDFIMIGVFVRTTFGVAIVVLLVIHVLRFEIIIGSDQWRCA